MTQVVRVFLALLLTILGVLALPHAMLMERPGLFSGLQALVLPYLIGLAVGATLWRVMRRTQFDVSRVHPYGWLTATVAVILAPLLWPTSFGRHLYPGGIDPILIALPFFVAGIASLSQRQGKDAPSLSCCTILGRTAVLCIAIGAAAFLVPSAHALLLPLLLLLSGNTTVRRIGVMGFIGAVVIMVVYWMNNPFVITRILGIGVLPSHNMWAASYGVNYQATHIWLVLQDSNWFGSGDLIHLPGAASQLLAISIANGWGSVAFAGVFVLVGMWFYLTRPIQPAATANAMLGRMLWWSLIYLALLNAAVSLLVIRPSGPGLPMLSGNAALIVLAWLVMALSTNSAPETAADSPPRPWLPLVWMGTWVMAIAFVVATPVWLIKSQPKQSQNVHPQRAEILDREGNVLAANTPAISIWMDPQRFLAPCDKHACVVRQQHQIRITRLLEAMAADPMDQARARRILAPAARFGADEHFVYLAYKAPLTTGKALKVANLPGIGWHQTTQRDYPQSRLFAHVVGFTHRDEEGIGQDGLELAAQQALIPASPTLEQANLQASARYIQAAPLRTTLDRRIQEMTHAALIKRIGQSGATGGAVIVVNAQTSELLAMVSAPGFNPNDEASFRNPLREDRIFNHAVANSFPLGGLLTPLVVAQGIQQNSLTPDSRIDTGSGLLTVGQGNKAVHIRDPHPLGIVSVSEVMVQSSNVGAAKLILQQQPEALHDYLDRLGFGHDLKGKGLTRGVYSDLVDWRKWSPAIQSTLGLDIHASLMLVLQAYQPIASDGVPRPIHLIESIDSSECPMGYPSNYCAKQKVISSDTAAAMRRLLMTDANSKGTAPGEKVKGIEIAGIAATTSLPAGHAQPGIRGLFVGMAPADKPRYLIGVLLHYPNNAKSKVENTAAPLFEEVMQQLLVAKTAAR